MQLATKLQRQTWTNPTTCLKHNLKTQDLSVILPEYEILVELLRIICGAISVLMSEAFCVLMSEAITALINLSTSDTNSRTIDNTFMVT